VRVTLSEVEPDQLPLDALAVAVAAGEPLAGGAAELDGQLGGLLRELLAGEMKGRINELLPVPTGDRIAPRRVILYGLGAARDLDGQRLRFAHQELVRAARTYGYRRLGVLRSGPLDEDSLAAVVEGCVMGGFERRNRQTGSGPGPLDELVLAGFTPGHDLEVAAAHELGEAVNRAREWSNAPANELTPDVLAQAARVIADSHGLEFEVLGPAELRAGGYNLLLGVAAGSAQPPRLIRLRWRGAEGLPRLALVGKGITFDTGGISLKDPLHMSRMKGDMAGAAAALAAIQVIAHRRLPLDVTAVLAATENMPGASAQRPGDVWVSADGKTVEVVNTDAEGRLVLADAVTHALRNGATHVLDLATLTGAATIALGHAGTAAISNDDGFWGQVAEAGRRAGERLWRLPAYPDYRVLLRSQIADLRNSEYGEAGTIAGGMFIGEFVQGKPWVHLDIAASSWNTNAELTTVPRGPSGVGTRTCVYLAELLAAGAR